MNRLRAVKADKQTGHNLWSRRDWRHWAIAIPLGAVLVFLLPMFLGWG